jgi:hypothetical protein
MIESRSTLPSHSVGRTAARRLATAAGLAGGLLAACLVLACASTAGAEKGSDTAAAARPATTSGQLSAAAEAAALVEEQDVDPWPRVVEGSGLLVKMHPIQADDWNGQSLSAHAAVEIEEKGKEGATYGVLTFTVRTRVDKEARLVVFDEYQGIRADIPTHPEQEPKLLGFLQRHLDDALRVVSLDRVETALAASRAGEATAGQVEVGNEPPRIVFAERPAILVYVDGEPVWRPVEGTAGEQKYERLLNTRPLVLKHASGSLHLHLFDGWLTAATLAGPWGVAPKGSPAGIDAAAKKAIEHQPADLLEGGGSGQKEVDADGKPIPAPTLAKGPVPDVVVATEPTELVVTDGAAEWIAIPDTALEFVENTTGNVFRSGDTYYVLLSGRWFEAPGLEGPWSFVPQERLAADFRAIPDDSPKENVKASVAGTAQAEEAVIANSIPQTSEIDREGARFEPTLDGEPRFEAVEGTSLEYVANSPTPILRVSPDEYYALSNGVWFVAAALSGPWKVAAHVPEVVYTIPASSPLHYVTYVRVYDADQDSVVVGYTPGYYGTVVSDDVVVYGTGYYHSPWIGSYWYGYPSTWGFGCGITYTPWGGWSFSIGVGWGWGYWGGWYAPYYPPYWGPYWGYYPYYYGGVVAGAGGGWAAWGPGGWAGTTGNIYNQWGPVSTVSRYSGGFDAWSGTAWRGQVGTAYNSRTGTIAAGQRGAVANVYSGEYAYGGRGVAQGGSGNTVKGGRITAGDVDTGQSGSAGWVRGEQGGAARVGDDVYAGKDGSVYKRNDKGDWTQVQRSGQWEGVDDRARTQDLNRQAHARSSGSQRYQGYRQSTPRMPRGGMRGGGRRR